MMPQQKNKKILIYLFLFVLLGTISNKNLNKFEIPRIDKVKITGLSDEDNSKLLSNFDFLKIENLLTLDKKKLDKIISSNNLVEKYLIYKRYPSSLEIKIYKTDFLAYVKKDGINFLLGSNDKFVYTEDIVKKIPLIHGNFKNNDFKNLKQLIDESNFDFKEIKNLYFFPSGRWDMETYSGILIRLPKNKVKENIDLLTIILADKEFKKANLIDLRQDNQIIINEQ